MAIRPDVPGPEFLARLRDIVQERTTYQILREGPWSLGENFDAFLDIELKEHESPPNLRVRLMSTSLSPVKVEVHLFAGPDWPSGLTYLAYTSAGREAIRPLLKAYNQRFGTRLKLHVPPPARPRKLPPGAKKLFDQYALAADLSGVYPLAWSRFYKFVIYCHDHHIRFGVEELKEALHETGVDKQTISELAAAYRHGRAVLGLQSEARREWLGERYRQRRAKQAHNA